MTKSEKTKRRKSLLLGVLSLVLLVTPFVNGVLGVFWKLFFLASFVLGILAINSGRSSKSVITVVLGGIGVVLSLFFFLAMSFVVLSNISATISSYLTQMQALSRGIQQYCQQNDGTLPDADAWCDQLMGSAGNLENFSIDTFQSGSYIEYGSDTAKERGFAFNKYLDGNRLSDIGRPTVLLFEADFEWNQNGTSAILLSGKGHPGYWPFYARGYYFILVAPDSTFTVKFIKHSELDSLNWTPTGDESASIDE